MIKVIVKRLWKQRKINLWLFIELMFVFVLMAALVDCMYMYLKPISAPLGYNLKNVYSIRMGYNFDYFRDDQSDESVAEIRDNSIREVMRKLEQYSDIEYSTVFFGVNPYIDKRVESFYVDSLKKFQTDIFFTDKNFFMVFDIYLLQGTFDERAMNEYPRTAIISNNLADSLFRYNKKGAVSKQNIIGQTFYDEYNKDKSYKIIGVAPAVKLNPIDQYVMCAFLPLEEWMMRNTTPYIAVKVKRGAEDHFDLNFYHDIKKRVEIGPYYLDEVTSYTQMADDASINNSVDRVLKTGILFVFFLFLNVFLGVMGSFWFRTYSRRGEIGLKRALGAPSSQILKELTMEGGTLLLIASVPALIICINMMYFELPVTEICDFTIWRALTDLILPYLLLFMMVYAGIWYPARRAMKMIPADALHTE